MVVDPGHQDPANETRYRAFKFEGRCACSGVRGDRQNRLRTHGFGLRRRGHCGRRIDWDITRRSSATPGERQQTDNLGHRHNGIVHLQLHSKRSTSSDVVRMPIRRRRTDRLGSAMRRGAPVRDSIAPIGPRCTTVWRCQTGVWASLHREQSLLDGRYRLHSGGK